MKLTLNQGSLGKDDEEEEEIDPVITPSGITYMRKVMEEHHQCARHFDPIPFELR